MSGSSVNSVTIIFSFIHQTSISQSLLLVRCQGDFSHMGIPKRSKLVSAEFLKFHYFAIDKASSPSSYLILTMTL